MRVIYNAYDIIIMYHMYNITIMKIIVSIFFFSDKHPEKLGDLPVWVGLKPRQSGPTRQSAPATALDCIFLVQASEPPLSLPVQRAAEHRDLWSALGLNPALHSKA